MIQITKFYVIIKYYRVINLILYGLDLKFFLFKFVYYFV